jgi:SPP1 family predicted phage head-tail adaptor
MADTKLRAGDLRDQVRIERTVTTTTDTGGQADSGVTVVATDWAQIEPFSAGFQTREQISLGGQQTSLTHRVRMWYRTDIRPIDRVIEVEAPGRTFEIVVPPQPDQWKREITLLCVEKVS